MDDDTTPAQAKTRQPRSKNAQQRMAAGAKTIQNDVVKRTRGKVGQPTKFTPELWGEIIDRVACYENLLDICADPHMPCYMTVRSWYRANPELKAEMEEAWLEASYLGHAVNDNILRGGVMSTQDFRRDEAIVANNRWFMGKTSTRLFGDKKQVDLTSTISIAVPDWVNPVTQLVEDGQLIDPDLVYEQQTVERIQQAVTDKAIIDVTPDEPAE